MRSSLSKNDFLREIIHALGFFVPVLASFIGIAFMSMLIFVIMVFYFISELLRMNGKYLPIISLITLNTVSKSERYDFARYLHQGLTYNGRIGSGSTQKIRCAGMIPVSPLGARDAVLSSRLVVEDQRNYSVSPCPFCSSVPTHV